MSTDTPQRILREKLRHKRTELILETAEEVLGQKGYHGSSMDEIAARAGVSKGTLYQHFPTKEKLFFALIEHALVRFEQMVQQAASSSSNAREKLGHILAYIYGERRGAHSQLLRLLHANEDLHQQLWTTQSPSRERLDQAIDQIRNILEDGKAAGLFETTITTELMLQLFLNLLSLSGQGYLFTWDQETSAGVPAQLERFFFEGIQAHQ